MLKNVTNQIFDGGSTHLQIGALQDEDFLH